MRSKKRSWFAEVPADLRDWVDHRRIVAHLRMVPHGARGTATSLLSIGVGLVLAGAMHGRIGLGFAAVTLCCVLTMVYRLRIAATGAGPAEAPSKPLIRNLSLSYLVDGTAFGVAIALALPVLPPACQLLIAIVAISISMATGYVMRTLPIAAFAFLVPLCLGMLAALVAMGSPVAYATLYPLIGATALTADQILTMHALFVNRILRERELRASNRTVKLLLNEYEESGSDWLFELDGEGRMLRVSERFAQAAGCPAEDLNGRAFVGLFEAGPGRTAVAECLGGRKPLRDAVVSVTRDGGQAWWSVSGRPAYVSGQDRVAFRGAISDITHQKQAESRVRHMAHYDGLTGLPNRAQFNTVLGQMLDDRQSDERVALLLIDVDHFKAVNDMYGHPAGDAFLRQVAERMQAKLDASGLGGEQRLIARLGGDEFAIVLAGEDAVDQAVRLSEELREAIAETFVIDTNELDTSISVGIALAPDHAELAGQLQVNADIALYAAKGYGRNRWEMFEAGMDQQLHERHSLARDLRHSVVRGELRLFLQPLIDLEDNAKSGYEALLRWEHPSRGMVMPDAFIPLAEETGLIVPIGEWVIRTAFAEAAGWDEPLSIAVNLSPIQLSSANLVPTVLNALAETGIDPGRVEFEITEGVLLHNSEVNIATLNQLHALGVKIALDDFGTGYASLNYLLTFPFDKIKIDRRFIDDIEHREESKAIVGAVIGLANSLGMCTLAEGVEDEAQLASLREHGCRMVQGWLFGRAMPIEHYYPVKPGVTIAPNLAEITIRAANTMPAPPARKRGAG